MPARSHGINTIEYIWNTIDGNGLHTLYYSGTMYNFHYKGWAVTAIYLL